MAPYSSDPVGDAHQFMLQEERAHEEPRLCPSCGSEMFNDWDLNIHTREIENDRWRCKCGYEEKVKEVDRE